MNKQKKDSVVIAVTLKQDMVNQIDALASRMGIKTNRLVGNLIGIGLDEFKVLRKYGILKNGLFVLSLLEQYGILQKKKKEDAIRHPRAVSISIRISKDMNEELDKWAIEADRTRNKLIECCMAISIDEFNFLRNVGILNAGLALVKLEDKIRGKLDEKKIMKIWNNRFKEAKDIGKEMFNVVIK